MENGSVFLKHEISTSLAGLLRGVGLTEALSAVKEAGFRRLDFPISVFSRPVDSPLKSSQWRQWTKELKTRLDGEGFTVTQAHASWEQAIPQDFREEDPFEVYYRTVEACRTLGCSRLVFHAPLYFFPTPETATQERIHRWNVTWFRKLLPILEEFSVTAELENTFDYRRVWREGDPTFTYTTAPQMLRLMEELDSPRFRLCLDTGHANIAGQNPMDMIASYGKNLEVLHLNDNFGFIRPVYEDLHLLPGHGNLPWVSIFDALKNMDYQGNFNLEPVGALPNLPHELQVIQLRAAREFIEALAKSVGF